MEGFSGLNTGRYDMSLGAQLGDVPPDRVSPHYPQSNGKLERWRQSLKTECIRPGTPLSLDDARRIVGRYVEHYNTVRLRSAIGYIASKDKLEGRAEAILAARDAKLAAAREGRRLRRQQAREKTC